MRRWFLIGGLTAFVLLLDIVVLGQWSFLRLGFNLTVCWLITVSIIEGQKAGWLAAVVSGVTWSLVSTITGPAHLLAMLSLPAAVWLLSVKVFTTRSAISFISTIIISTVVFTLVLVSIEYLAVLIDRDRLHVAWSAQLWSMVFMCLTHPVLISLGWRFSGRGSYTKVTDKMNISF